MLRYSLKSNTSIFITNDKDINILQDKNPETGVDFASKDEAITWAKKYASELGQSIIESEVKIDEKTELQILKDQLEKLQARTDSTENAILNMMEFSL